MGSIVIKIDFLKNHPHTIPTLANIWHETIGEKWMPEIKIEKIEALSYEEINQDIPFSLIALHEEIPVGFCTLELNADIREDLGPWIGDLVIDPKYQNQGIGKTLLKAMIEQAKELKFTKLYLFTFDLSIIKYYRNLGWKKVAIEKFKTHLVTIMEIEL